MTDELLLISEQRRIRANQLKWKKEAELMEEARKRFREKLSQEDEEEFKISKLIFAPRSLGKDGVDFGSFIVKLHVFLKGQKRRKRSSSQKYQSSQLSQNREDRPFL